MFTPQERKIRQLSQPQGDDLNCRMRRLGGDEKRDLVAKTDMFTGAGAVFVGIVLDYSYSRALVYSKGGCISSIRSC